MSLDLDSLRHFELAATTLNFRAAAARAHLSPAAFSERIRRLEQELGITLFERTTRTVRLTPAAARLLPHARASIAAADDLKTAAVAEGRSWELTIGTRFELGLSWLTPALDTLALGDPTRTIHLSVGDTGPLTEAVRHGRIDAMVSSARLTSDELVSAPLHVEEYRFVAHPGLIARRPFTAATSAGTHTLLDVNPLLPLFRYLLDQAGGPVWPFAHREYLGGIGSVRARALAGRGVAVLPEYFIRDDLKNGELIELLPALKPASDAFRLVWRSGHPRGAQLLALAAELRAIPLR